jgi:hypothetical protein
LVLTAFSVLSPAIGRSCHRHPREALASRELDAGVEASGPHGFTVRDQRFRLVRYPRPSHPAPNVRDDRETPLFIGHGMTLLYCCFYPFEKRYFFAAGLDKKGKSV